MYTDGVEVFHRADGEHVASAVAQNFKLDFLPSAYVLFDKYLRDGRKHKTVMSDEPEFFFVISNATACAAERIRRAHDNGIAADFFGYGYALVYCISDVGRNYRLTDFVHRLLEKFSVLRSVYAVNVYADELYAVFVKEAFLGKFAAERKSRLTAEGCEKAVRTFLYYYSFKRFDGKRLEINFVCERAVRHDSCGVGVAQYDVKSGVFHYSARLCACVVEFGSLTYYYGTRTYYEYFFNIFSFRHYTFPPSYSL